MKTAFCIACALLVVGVWVVEGTPFETCGEPAFIPRRVQVAPNPPKAGGDINVTIRGRSEITAEKGRFSYKVEYRVRTLVKSFWAPLDDGEEDICEYTNCPIKPGFIFIRYTNDLPDIMPGGDYKITVTAKDQDDRQLLCVVMYIKINAAEEKSTFAGQIRKRMPMLLDPYPYIAY